MKRKDKIDLLNKLELGVIPIEMFHPITIKYSIIKSIDFRNSESRKNDEDLPELESNSLVKNFGINPYTGTFYGNIKILIVT